MNIGFCNHIFINYLSLDETINWAGQKKIDCIEIAVGVPPIPKGNNSLLDAEMLIKDERYFNQLNEKLELNKIFISSLFYYGANMLDSNLKNRAMAIGGLNNAIIAANKLKVPVIVISSGSPHKRPIGAINPWGIYFHAKSTPVGNKNKTEALNLFSSVFKPIIKFAEKCNIRIAFEPSSLGGGIGNLGYTPELLDEIFERIPSDFLGICYDPSHLYWMQIDYLKYLKKYTHANKVFMVHAKDAIIEIDRLRYVGVLGADWWQYRLPGWGEIDWRDFISVLYSGGYNYVINIENEDESYGFSLDLKTFKRKVVPSLAKEGIIYSKKYLEGTMKAIDVNYGE